MNFAFVLITSFISLGSKLFGLSPGSIAQQGKSCISVFI
jgi:hypothetical protein